MPQQIVPVILCGGSGTRLWPLSRKRFPRARSCWSPWRRNLSRFPADFMFQLSSDEFKTLRSQTVTSKNARGGRRTAPYAFTEQGVAMLSSVLDSPRAIGVNIEIMRTFVRVRELAATHSELAKRLSELEEKTELVSMQHDTFSRNTRNQLKQVFDALRELMTPPNPPKRPIGFVTHQERSKFMPKTNMTTPQKTALITGVTGQDGSYLAEFLLEKGYTVHGIKRRASLFNTQRVDHIYQDPHVDNARFKLHYGDLSDSSNLTRIIQETQPDEIYNLGAQSHVAVSFESPEYTADVGGMGTS